MSDGTNSGPAMSYVAERNGGYWVRGTRVSLDSVVHAFKRGTTPESIQRSFPVLTLEEVYGAITYYLAHARDVDAYLGRAEKNLADQALALNAAAREDNPHLFQRLHEARHEGIMSADDRPLPG